MVSRWSEGRIRRQPEECGGVEALSLGRRRGALAAVERMNHADALLGRRVGEGIGEWEGHRSGGTTTVRVGSDDDPGQKDRGPRAVGGGREVGGPGAELARQVGEMGKSVGVVLAVPLHHRHPHILGAGIGWGPVAIAHLAVDEGGPSRLRGSSVGGVAADMRRKVRSAARSWGRCLHLGE